MFPYKSPKGPPPKLIFETVNKVSPSFVYSMRFTTSVFVWKLGSKVGGNSFVPIAINKLINKKLKKNKSLIEKFIWRIQKKTFYRLTNKRFIQFLFNLKEFRFNFKAATHSLTFSFAKIPSVLLKNSSKPSGPFCDFSYSNACMIISNLSKSFTAFDSGVFCDSYSSQRDSNSDPICDGNNEDYKW